MRCPAHEAPGGGAGLPDGHLPLPWQQSRRPAGIPAQAEGCLLKAAKTWRDLEVSAPHKACGCSSCNGPRAFPWGHQEADQE